MDGYSIYINTDENGNIKDALLGFRSIPRKKYTFHFYFENEFEDDITDYKVVINGYETKLVKK